MPISAFSMPAMHSVCHLGLSIRALTEMTKMDDVILNRD